MAEIEIGRVDGYFAKIGVVGIRLTGELQVGDTVHIRGHTTEFSQAVESIQIEGAQVERGAPGESVGIKVAERCRSGDHVYKVTS